MYIIAVHLLYSQKLPLKDSKQNYWHFAQKFFLFNQEFLDTGR